MRVWTGPLNETGGEKARQTHACTEACAAGTRLKFSKMASVSAVFFEPWF